MSVTPLWLCTVAYRLGQVWQQLGFVPPLSIGDKQEVQRWLPSSALPLFYSMSNADQQHSLRVCRGLQAQDCTERDMLAAALLHDVGKAQGRVPFWTRPVIVLGKHLMPQSMMRVIFPLSLVALWTDEAHPSGLSIDDQNLIDQSLQRISSRSHLVWRRALSYAWWHAEIGANLAAHAGLSERTVLYIRTHHQPYGPAAALHRVDEVS